ncbi:hypothetical protein K449DRAFT_469793 [Hypoxylon sp. EC38]|nr:hypothetical protein K449DRAFT_469793 [Hypoxylon sp. EC38]
MSSSTASKKTTIHFAYSMSSMTDKENPGSNAGTKEQHAKLSPEEKAKKSPWYRYCQKVTPTAADQVSSDLWDEI